MRAAVSSGNPAERARTSPPKHLRPVVVMTAAIVAAGGTLFTVLLPRSPGSSARDEHWRQDIAYLARKLRESRYAGTGSLSHRTWMAAAARLEARVPGLTESDLYRHRKAVASLRDDETRVSLNGRNVFGRRHLGAFPLYWQWFGGAARAQGTGGNLYLLAAPARYALLIGSRLIAIDGRPVATILAKIAPAVTRTRTS